MLREEPERNITASTSEGDNSQLAYISPQYGRPKTFEKDSLRESLTKGRETLNPSMGEGTATRTLLVPSGR